MIYTIERKLFFNIFCMNILKISWKSAGGGRHLIGFTLVELIIVITILSILSLIAFVGYSKYTLYSRDTHRISSLTQVWKWLQIFATTTGKYPLPDDKIHIENSGEILSIQWNVWETTKHAGRIIWNIVDPKDGTLYTYTTNQTQQKYQLLAFLELPQTQSIISSVSAQDSQRFPYLYGNNIGILTDIHKNPVQNHHTNIDLWSGNDEYILITQEKIISDSKDDIIIQYNSLETNTLACPSQIYNDYSLSSLNHWITGNFTKTEPITHGTRQWNLEIWCSNWEFDFPNAQENMNIVCEVWYISDNTNCIPDECSWNVPDNALSNASSQLSSASWGYSETPWVCTFICEANYMWSSGSCVPSNYTISGTITNYPNRSLSICGTNVTTNASWAFTLSRPAWTNCNNLSLSRPWFTCSVNTNGPANLNSNFTTVAWNCNDNIAPTFDALSVAPLSCGVARATILWAVDIGIWLHATPYSFNGWVSWQASNIYDITGTSYSLPANTIRVRDASGNTYFHTTPMSGTIASECLNITLQSWSLTFWQQNVWLVHPSTIVTHTSSATFTISNTSSSSIPLTITFNGWNYPAWQWFYRDGWTCWANLSWNSNCTIIVKARKDGLNGGWNSTLSQYITVSGGGYSKNSWGLWASFSQFCSTSTYAPSITRPANACSSTQLNQYNCYDYDNTEQLRTVPWAAFINIPSLTLVWTYAFENTSASPGTYRQVVNWNYQLTYNDKWTTRNCMRLWSE